MYQSLGNTDHFRPSQLGSLYIPLPLWTFATSLCMRVVGRLTLTVNVILPYLGYTFNTTFSLSVSHKPVSIFHRVIKLCELKYWS